ncbi:hypothetical protein DFH94DRAFT_33407 [Russula ochroleuca]|uniref:Secreted protein n=1 Tax=Russula ochroleuca TaxID=152965 RepID=A0A9P5MUB7_9AGAM|nr:hypothetical protein DFH94DRAFT_33407 [Russula ochroleuca]
MWAGFVSMLFRVCSLLHVSETRSAMVIIVHVLWVVSRQANMFLEPSSSGSPASRRRLQYLDGMLERNPVMSCRSGLCLNHFKHVLLYSVPFAYESPS